MKNSALTKNSIISSPGVNCSPGLIAGRKMDILGRALTDFLEGAVHHRLWVHDHIGPKVEMEIAVYFRTDLDMPELELRALEECKGKVLDIGAGAGSHALALQDRGLAVTAIDISPGAVSVMKERGVADAKEADIFTYNDEKYDTLLLLMNGIGLTGNTEGLRLFLRQAQQLLLPGGQLLFDSSDVAYLFEETGFPEAGHYYGEISCRYEYRRQKTDWFSWLYIDRDMLQQIASEEGWRTEILLEDDSDQYLARLQLL